MINQLLRPTPSEGWKLHLVLRLGASIVLRIDVLLGIAPIVCLLMICTPPRLGAWSRCVAVLHIETARETHVAVSFAMLEYIGAVFRAAAPTPGTPGTKACTMLAPIPPWRTEKLVNGVRGARRPPGTMTFA